MTRNEPNHLIVTNPMNESENMIATIIESEPFKRIVPRGRSELRIPIVTGYGNESVSMTATIIESESSTSNVT